jgi:hypothetical protein
MNVPDSILQYELIEYLSNTDLVKYSQICKHVEKALAKFCKQRQFIWTCIKSWNKNMHGSHNFDGCALIIPNCPNWKYYLDDLSSFVFCPSLTRKLCKSHDLLHLFSFQQMYDLLRSVKTNLIQDSDDQDNVKQVKEIMLYCLTTCNLKVDQKAYLKNKFQV